jgi:hypothetical protein
MLGFRFELFVVCLRSIFYVRSSEGARRGKITGRGKGLMGGSHSKCGLTGWFATKTVSGITVTCIILGDAEQELNFGFLKHRNRRFVIHAANLKQFQSHRSRSDLCTACSNDGPRRLDNCHFYIG